MQGLTSALSSNEVSSKSLLKAELFEARKKLLAIHENLCGETVLLDAPLPLDDTFQATKYNDVHRVIATLVWIIDNMSEKENIINLEKISKNRLLCPEPTNVYVPIHLDAFWGPQEKYSPEEIEFSITKALITLFITCYEKVKGNTETLSMFCSKTMGFCIDERTKMAFNYALTLEMDPLAIQPVKKLADIVESVSDALGERGQSFFLVLNKIINDEWGNEILIDAAGAKAKQYTLTSDLYSTIANYLEVCEIDQKTEDFLEAYFSSNKKSLFMRFLLLNERQFLFQILSEPNLFKSTTQKTQFDQWVAESNILNILLQEFPIDPLFALIFSKTESFKSNPLMQTVLNIPLPGSLHAEDLSNLERVLNCLRNLLKTNPDVVKKMLTQTDAKGKNSGILALYKNIAALRMILSFLIQNYKILGNDILLGLLDHCSDYVLSALSAEEKIACIEAGGMNCIDALVKDYRDFTNILNALPTEKRSDFIRGTGDHINNIITNIGTLQIVMVGMSPDQISDLIHGIKLDGFCAQIMTGYELLPMLKIWPKEKHGTIIQALSDRIKTIVKEDFTLYSILNFLSAEQKNILIQQMGFEHIASVIHNYNSFFSILINLSPQQIIACIQAIGFLRVSAFLKNETSLNDSLSRLSLPEQREAFLQALDNLERDSCEWNDSDTLLNNFQRLFGLSHLRDLLSTSSLKFAPSEERKKYSEEILLFVSEQSLLTESRETIKELVEYFKKRVWEISFPMLEKQSNFVFFGAVSTQISKNDITRRMLFALKKLEIQAKDLEGLHSNLSIATESSSIGKESVSSSLVFKV